MAPTEAAREAEDDQPIDAEQPAPFERMADDADSAYSGLAGIVSADALYDVLDLRKELANFLREADKPLSAGLSGLQEIATSANWALPVSPPCPLDLSSIGPQAPVLMFTAPR